MPMLTKKWAKRWLAATQTTPNLGCVMMTALRDDIEALADSLFRAGYKVRPDIATWLIRVNNSVIAYKAN